MNKTAKIVFWLIVIALVIWGISSFSNKELPSETKKVGVLLMLSGDSAKYGERAKNSIEMALKEYEKENSSKSIELIYEDTASETRQTLSAYQKLVTVDRVDAIIGPLFLSEMSGIGPQIKKDKIPVISLGLLTKELRSGVSNPLVIWPDPTLEAGQMAQYIYARGVRTIAVVGTQDSWDNEVSEAFTTKFENLGGKVVAKEIVLPDSTDVRLAAAKVKTANPEAIFLGTYYQFFNFTKTLRELGYKGKLYSIEIDSDLAKKTVAYTSGLRFISPDFYTPDFVDKYRAAYGEIPSLPAGQAYDATQLMFRLLDSTGSQAEMLKAMEQIKEYDGASGKIIFTNHQATFPLSIFELQNGEIVRLEN